MSSYSENRMSSQLSSKVRLSCRMDRGLMLWVQMYAKQHDTTITQIIKDHFRDLRNQHSALKRREVDQI
jgi:hypothetical protein